MCILYKQDIIKINGKKILYATSKILQFFVRARCVSRIWIRLGSKYSIYVSVKRRVLYSKNSLFITYFMLSRTGERSKNDVEDTVEEGGRERRE